MNPVLGKLRGSKLSKGAIADLLEKHIGDGSNESHCEIACEALRRIRDEDTRDYVEIIRILQSSNGFSPCEVVKQVIKALRAVVRRERQGIDERAP